MPLCSVQLLAGLLLFATSLYLSANFQTFKCAKQISNTSYYKFNLLELFTNNDPNFKLLAKEQRRGTSFCAEELADHFLKQHELVDDFILCQYNSSIAPLTTQSNPICRPRSHKRNSCTCPCECRTTDRYKSGEFRNKRCRYFSSRMNALCAPNEPSVGGIRNASKDSSKQQSWERSQSGQYTNRRYCRSACPITCTPMALRENLAAVKPPTNHYRGTRAGRPVFGPGAQTAQLTLMLGNQEIGGGKEAAKEWRHELVCSLSALLILAADQTPWEMGRRFRDLLHGLLSQCFGQCRSRSFHRSVFVSLLHQLTNRFFAAWYPTTMEKNVNESLNSEIFTKWHSKSTKDHILEQFWVNPVQHQFNTETILYPSFGVSRSNANTQQQPANDSGLNNTSFLPTLSPTQDDQVHLDHVGYRLATMAFLPGPLPAGMFALVLVKAGFHFDLNLSSESVTCHRCRASYDITGAQETAGNSPFDWHRFVSRGCCPVLRSCDHSSITGSWDARNLITGPITAITLESTTGPITAITLESTADVMNMERPQFGSSVVPEYAFGFTSTTFTGQVLANPQAMGIQFRSHIMQS